ncbi:hypothetical protein [Microvirga massiliensis]|jgi:hypothetical protein|nr:hypothetical protein [Microvirga massiliensis]
MKTHQTPPKIQQKSPAVREPKNERQTPVQMTASGLTREELRRIVIGIIG